MRRRLPRVKADGGLDLDDAGAADVSAGGDSHRVGVRGRLQRQRDRVEYQPDRLAAVGSATAVLRAKQQTVGTELPHLQVDIAVVAQG